MLERIIGELKTNTILTRSQKNPILTGKEIPYAECIAYNGGVVKFEGRYVSLIRVDHADLKKQKLTQTTDIALAFSDDGLEWSVEPQPCIAWHDEEIIAASDPRLMLVEGRCLITVAVQTVHGMETYCLTTKDFTRFETVFKMVPDNRDVVLFSERVGENLFTVGAAFHAVRSSGEIGL